MLDLPDCRIGAGFVRDAVWDDRHGYPVAPPSGDVDVLWFDPAADAIVDRRIERDLRQLLPAMDWSVKNQARMHRRNGDSPYGSVHDAMAMWPETATAVAVRWPSGAALSVSAPFGLGDLFAPRLRPTPAFVVTRRAILDRRVREKRWIERYPLLDTV